MVIGQVLTEVQPARGADQLATHGVAAALRLVGRDAELGRALVGLLAGGAAALMYLPPGRPAGRGPRLRTGLRGALLLWSATGPGDAVHRPVPVLRPPRPRPLPLVVLCAAVRSVWHPGRRAGR